jgi:copper chaperone CopZ
MNPRRFASAAFLSLSVAAPASAELRQVRLNAPGMDCASCARAMSKAVKQLDGVESVDLIVEKSSVEIRLRADNRVTLERIRREMRAFGYQTKDAEITARGRITDSDGTPVLDLLNGSVLRLAEKPASPPSGPVEITGVSTLDEKLGERVTIATVKRLPESLIARP